MFIWLSLFGRITKRGNLLGHPYRFRVGWEGERLAHYLLSRFSFVAQPTTVADDLGSDFFCTIFDLVNSPVQMAEPRGSFAIQVKSGAGPIEAHNKIDYLQHLEIPFFIGIVSQSPPQMDVYTAELLPLLFAYFGLPKKLWLCPVAREDYNPQQYCSGDAQSGVRLHCPHVSTFEATETRDNLRPKVGQLNTICKRTRLNIAARSAEEHIYEVDEKGQLIIFAGSGSAQYFRNNFYKRLAEVFYNLQWILKNQPANFSIDEFRLYESLYRDLQKLPNQPPSLSAVSNVYLQLKSTLETPPVE